MADKSWSSAYRSPQPPGIMANEKLNFGCGSDIREGWVNLDIIPRKGVIVHDMMDTPYPFPDETFMLIDACGVLEHIPHYHFSGKDGFQVAMEELFRIMKPGAYLRVLCPHYKNRFPNEYPFQHSRVIYPETWEDFSGASYYPSSAKFMLTHMKTTARIAIFHRWKLRNIPVFEHIRKRLPFLTLLVTKPFEIEYILRKPHG